MRNVCYLSHPVYGIFVLAAWRQAVWSIDSRAWWGQLGLGNGLLSFKYSIKHKVTDSSLHKFRLPVRCDLSTQRCTAETAAGGRASLLTTFSAQNWAWHPPSTEKLHNGEILDFCQWQWTLKTQYSVPLQEILIVNHPGPRAPKFKPGPYFHNQHLSAAVFVSLSKKRPMRISSYFSKKFMALLITSKKGSWICRQPQVVNEQLLWLIQRDQVFQTKDQAQVLCHF